MTKFFWVWTALFMQIAFKDADGYAYINCWTCGGYSNGNWEWSCFSPETNITFFNWALGRTPQRLNSRAIYLSRATNFMYEDIDKSAKIRTIICEAASSSGKCLPGYHHFVPGNANCHRIQAHSNGYTWLEAESQCASWKGHLVQFETETEYTDIKNYLISIAPKPTSNPTTASMVPTPMPNAMDAGQKMALNSTCCSCLLPVSTNKTKTNDTSPFGDPIRPPTVQMGSTSESDSRPSAIGLGVAAIVMLITCLSGIILLDVSTLAKHIARMKKNLRYAWERHRKGKSNRQKVHDTGL